MEERLKKYREAVEYSALKHLDNLLHNEGNEHALILFENILKYSKKHVRIAASDMANTEVVNRIEYIESMNAFLDNKDAKLDILLTHFKRDDINALCRKENLFFMLYKSKAYKEGRVRIKDSLGKCFKEKSKPIHFCTSDGHAYRIERDIEHRIAQGNFGDSATTKVLEELFDSAFNTIPSEVNLADVFNN